jgi:hypothetical protein
MNPVIVEENEKLSAFTVVLLKQKHIGHELISLSSIGGVNATIFLSESITSCVSDKRGNNSAYGY